ncbi:hypothetical protein JW721_04925 [Candidatus Micrarchaeota archaeon]|nr:hypothetical protein [Candidatus Micrarchaeota archaeon]
MGEIPDYRRKMKKAKERLRGLEPELFEKGEIGILEGSKAHKKRKCGKKKG